MFNPIEIVGLIVLVLLVDWTLLGGELTTMGFNIILIFLTAWFFYFIGSEAYTYITCIGA